MSLAKKGLGKGLDALIPGASILEQEDSSKGSGVREVAINIIDVNPHQPRIEFEDQSLMELASSIKKHGVLQPLIVSPKEDHFELIAGERRLRAAKIAELSKVPVIVREVKEHEKLEVAIIENIQRKDLNPIEEAASYRKLIEEFNYSQEEAAHAIGKSRSTVANKIRLLSLSTEIKRALRDGKITEGHAKALLSVEDETKRQLLFEQTLLNSFNVREVEKIATKVSEKIIPKKESEGDRLISQLAHELGEYLGAKVAIKNGRRGGKIEVSYYSYEELTRIYQAIKEK